MKKKTILLLLLLLGLELLAQELNDNPINPKNETVKKTIALQFISFARENNEKFIFKNPANIAINQDGSFYLTDRNQVFRFNADGIFSSITVRSGQGPSEAIHLTQLFITADELFINTGIMGKLIICHANGSLKYDYQIPKTRYSNDKGLNLSESTFQILGLSHKNELLMMSNSISAINNDPDTIHYVVKALSPKNGWKDDLFTIPVKAATYHSSLGKFALADYPIINTSDSRNIFFCNTAQYEISRYNIAKNVIDARWKKEYQPIAIPEKDRSKYQYGASMMGYVKGKPFKFQSPPPEYFRDIQRLFLVKGQLWVITSQVSDNKSVLVDVFDENGQYMDNFYLSFTGNLDLKALYHTPIAIGDHTLIVRESDETDNYVISLYHFSLD